MIQAVVDQKEFTRLVITCQVCEWYGEDGGDKGRWKMKGGSEYHLQKLTIDECVKLGPVGLAALAMAGSEKVCSPQPQRPSCHQSYEYMIEFGVFAFDEETYQEKETREMVKEGYMTEAQAKITLEKLQTYVMK